MSDSLPRLGFVFRTDVHASEHSPESWKGDYPAEIWSSLEQIGELARHFRANAVLDGGDFFHVKAPTQNSHRLVAKAALIHQVYPCPVYCIEGNHDIKHNNLETLPDQPLGVLYNSGVFHHLRNHRFVDGELEVRVVGVPYSPFRTLADLQGIRKKGNEVLIAIVHALAGENPPSTVEEFFGEPVFRYEQLIVDQGPDVWCFPPGTLVLDSLYRPVPIESITEGMAMSGRHCGQNAVEQVHPSRVVDEELIHLEIEGVPNFVAGATAEHPYWVAKGMHCVLPSRVTRRCHPDRRHTSKPCKGCERAPAVLATWVEAGAIQEGDFVGIPVPEVPETGPSDPGLARLLGYYASEGHILLNRAREPAAGVVWSFHVEETALHSDARQLVRDNFSLDLHSHKTSENCVQLAAYGRSISDFFLEHAGRYSEAKTLSSWIWQRPAADRLEFLRGWLLGDGHARSSKTEVMGSTASRSLAFQIYFLALSVGLRPSFTVRPPQRHAQFPAHVIAFYGDDGEFLSSLLGVASLPRVKTKVSGFFSEGLYYARVREVSRVRYQGPVHNFRTTTGEYVAGGALVHNCFGHWHQDQGVVQIGDRWFVNQGAVSRGALSRENLSRTPKVALIEVTREGVSVQTRELSVAPAADVFDLERKARSDRESKSIEQYVERIQHELQLDQQTPIEETLGKLDFAREVHELARFYLQQVRQQRGKAS